jgi:hypothetical protein
VLEDIAALFTSFSKYMDELEMYIQKSSFIIQSCAVARVCYMSTGNYVHIVCCL